MKAQSFINRAKQFWADRALKAQIRKVEHYISATPARDESPVLFFNASTRIHRLSLNGAYSLLASWALRAAGFPVRYLVCQAGMEQCVLGATLGDSRTPPPCRTCTRFSSLLFPDHLVVPLDKNGNKIEEIYSEISTLDLPGLTSWRYADVPFGELCMPGLQWSLRRANLADDSDTRHLYRQFLASAVNLHEHFHAIIASENPQAVLVFNGIFYPEATLRWVARSRGIPVITHEVGLQPFSAFFTREEATFRKVDLSEEFELDDEMNVRLDRYLGERFQGRFSMAGVRFWPQIVDLPEEVEVAIQAYKQTVVVFTNVIFDTSQVHANTYFEDMFAWLSYLEGVIQDHPETLFVLRAHPDEDRPGKSSHQSVSEWVRRRNLNERENVFLMEPSQYISSYELVERAKFVLVYNSSIGIEATIMGKPVLMAGRARYSHEYTAFIPEDRKEYESRLAEFLAQSEIHVPEEMIANARRLLFLELFHASLDLSPYLKPDPVLPGMVNFTPFDPEELNEDPVLETIQHGIRGEGDFSMPT